MEAHVVDATQAGALAVGSRVMLWGGQGPSDLGRVLQVTDLDGDVNEHGRPVAINPEVRVLFDDGLEDSLPTTGLARWYTEGVPRFQCEDLVVVPETLAEILDRLDPDGQDAR